MDPALFARGLILGFTIAAAVGPISLLVIRRTLAEGRVVGLVSGLGVATADAMYGAIAAFGLGAITDSWWAASGSSDSSAVCFCCGWPGRRPAPNRPSRPRSPSGEAASPAPTSRRWA